MLAGGGLLAAAVGGAAYAYSARKGHGEGEEIDNEEPELLEVPAKTWRESAGRDYGRDGYVFGDLSRGVIVRVFGRGGATDDAAAEAAGDAQHTQVQRLTREAVRGGLEAPSRRRASCAAG